jgi:hypothetical protein
MQEKKGKKGKGKGKSVSWKAKWMLMLLSVVWISDPPRLLQQQQQHAQMHFSFDQLINLCGPPCAFQDCGLIWWSNKWVGGVGVVCTCRWID